MKYITKLVAVVYIIWFSVLCYKLVGQTGPELLFTNGVILETIGVVVFSVLIGFLAGYF